VPMWLPSARLDLSSLPPPWHRACAGAGARRPSTRSGIPGPRWPLPCGWTCGGGTSLRRGSRLSISPLFAGRNTRAVRHLALIDRAIVNDDGRETVPRQGGRGSFTRLSLPLRHGALPDRGRRNRRHNLLGARSHLGRNRPGSVDRGRQSYPFDGPGDHDRGRQGLARAGGVIWRMTRCPGTSGP
jgi:hypothetical protein